MTDPALRVTVTRPFLADRPYVGDAYPTKESPTAPATLRTVEDDTSPSRATRWAGWIGALVSSGRC